MSDARTKNRCDYPTKTSLRLGRRQQLTCSTRKMSPCTTLHESTTTSTLRTENRTSTTVFCCCALARPQSWHTNKIPPSSALRWYLLSALWFGWLQHSTSSQYWRGRSCKTSTSENMSEETGTNKFLTLSPRSMFMCHLFLYVLAATIS